MRTLIRAATVAAAALAVLVPAVAAQAARTGPTVSFTGVAIQPNGSGPLATGCIVSPGAMTLTVTGMKGSPKAQFPVVVTASQGSTVLSTTTLGTLTKADNGVAEVVPVNDLGVPTLPFGTDTITVSLENPSGATVASQAQQFNCLALP